VVNVFGSEPIRVGNLHFCGEHTTVEWQGWMEGAAVSGIDAAKEVATDLGLDAHSPRTSKRPGEQIVND
jgi:monoamine oxidase